MPSLRKAFLFVCLVATVVVFYLQSDINSAYSIKQKNQLGSNPTKLSSLNEIKIKKATVGDIEIAYKKIGNGNGAPILLINEFAAPMDFWDRALISKLSLNHTVIIFDNRGIGNTTLGEQKFSIEQFANDTAGLLDALKLGKVDVMGWSMGGMIAQELAVKFPEKVNKLIILASSCGGKDAILPSQEVQRMATTFSTNSIEKIQKFLPLLFPDTWRTQNPNYLEKLPKTTEVITSEVLNLQLEAIVNWEGTCDKLKDITQPTLIVVGTDDIFTPPGNSLLMAEKISGSWLVQIKEGGHGLLLQYPETLGSILQAFLS